MMTLRIRTLFGLVYEVPDDDFTGLDLQSVMASIISDNGVAARLMNVSAFPKFPSHWVAASAIESIWLASDEITTVTGERI